MTDLHVVVSGQGTPVVLVHGVGASLDSWDGVVARLPGCRVLRYDLRGHGLSPRTPGPYSLDGFVDDLEGVLARIGWTSCHLVGFSLGGLVAQGYALRHPERLKSLAIVSSVAGRTDEERARVLARADTLATGGATAHLANSVERWFTDDFRAAHPEVVRQRVERSLGNDPATYAAAYRVLAESDLADRLPEIRVPTLAMTGEEDGGSTPRMTRLMAERIPGARAHVFPRLRHSVLLEAPDQVAAQLVSFIRDVEPVA